MADGQTDGQGKNNLPHLYKMTNDSIKGSKIKTGKSMVKGHSSGSTPKIEKLTRLLTSFSWEKWTKRMQAPSNLSIS